MTDNPQNPALPRQTALLDRLVLVSQSPQRQQLLRQAGYRFEVVAPRFDEPADLGRLPPGRHAQALAFYKASSVADAYPDRLLLGADTVVAAAGEIFGKPRDRDDARRILKILASRPHEVVTGVALLAPAAGRRIIAEDVTRVHMTAMTDEQLEAYLDRGDWRDKAGGYGIQLNSPGPDAFVERIEGSLSNVIGLPMELLCRLLAKFA